MTINEALHVEEQGSVNHHYFPRDGKDAAERKKARHTRCTRTSVTGGLSE